MQLKGIPAIATLSALMLAGCAHQMAQPQERDQGDARLLDVLDFFARMPGTDVKYDPKEIGDARVHMHGVGGGPPQECLRQALLHTAFDFHTTHDDGRVTYTIFRKARSR